MNIIFFEDNRYAFLPLVYTKPIAKLRIGILTIEEKWRQFLEKNNELTISYLTEPYLSKKYPLKADTENVFINSRFCPNEEMISLLEVGLQSNEAAFYGDTLVLAKCSLEDYNRRSFTRKEINESAISIELKNITDIFSENGDAIEADFMIMTEGRMSQELSSTNTLIGNRIFVEKGAKIEAAILNSKEGPIYIGKGVEVMEGSIVRGPLAMCDHSVLKLGTKIYGPTTIGPYSKVGGEVNNSVIQGYSNKGHDGFLGNSVIGEWCNLGADTNTSNLKNNYAEVKLWSYETQRFAKTGLQFCGLIMGDHSKCGINTMFNTGTVVGVCSNIYGSGFPRNFVSSFSWGGASGVVTHKLDKVFEVAQIVMARRSVVLSDHDREILTAIFENTDQFRK